MPAPTPTLITRLRGAVDVLYREMIKFGVVGAVAFVVDLGSFNLLLGTVFADRVSVGPVSSAVAATVISTILATIVAWLGNRAWTFRHRRSRPAHHELVWFFGTNGVALLIGAFCIAFSNKVLGFEGEILPTNIAKIVGIVLGTLFRFWAYRRFVFANEPLTDTSPLSQRHDD